MADKKLADIDFDSILRELSQDDPTAQKAFRKLVEGVAPNIYHSAKRILRSEAIAEDLVQDVLTAIWNHRQRLSGVNNFENFIYGMTRRMAFKLIRRSVNAEIIKREHLERLERRDDPSKEKYHQEIDNLIELLPSPSKQIFQLAKVEGLDRKEIASRFDISVNAVHIHVSRAMRFLKEHKHDVVSVIFLTTSFFHLIRS